MLVKIGKMGDANLLDAHGDLVVYSYLVRGVEYTASQEVSKLKQYLPAETSSLPAHVFVKYDARNPANSIILSEEWTGLQSRKVDSGPLRYHG